MINLKSPSRSPGQRQDFSGNEILIGRGGKKCFLAKIKFTELLPVLCFEGERQRIAVGNKSSSLPELKPS